MQSLIIAYLPIIVYGDATMSRPEVSRAGTKMPTLFVTRGVMKRCKQVKFGFIDEELPRLVPEAVRHSVFGTTAACTVDLIPKQETVPLQLTARDDRPRTQAWVDAAIHKVEKARLAAHLEAMTQVRLGGAVLQEMGMGEFTVMLPIIDLPDDTDFTADRRRFATRLAGRLGESPSVYPDKSVFGVSVVSFKPAEVGMPTAERLLNWAGDHAPETVDLYDVSARPSTYRVVVPAS